MRPQQSSHKKHTSECYNMPDEEMEVLLKEIAIDKEQIKGNKKFDLFLRQMFYKNLSLPHFQFMCFNYAQEHKTIPWSEEEKKFFWVHYGKLKPEILKTFFGNYPDMILELDAKKMLSATKHFSKCIDFDTLKKTLKNNPHPVINLIYDTNYGQKTVFSDHFSGVIQTQAINSQLYSYFIENEMYVNKELKYCHGSIYGVNYLDVFQYFYNKDINYGRYNNHFFKQLCEKLCPVSGPTVRAASLKLETTESGKTSDIGDPAVLKHTIQDVIPLLSVFKKNDYIKHINEINIGKMSKTANGKERFEQVQKIFNTLKDFNFDFLNKNGHDAPAIVFSNLSYFFSSDNSPDITIKEKQDILRNVLNIAPFNISSNHEIWGLFKTNNTMSREYYPVLKEHLLKHNQQPTDLMVILKIVRDYPEDIELFSSIDEDKWFSSIQMYLKNVQNYQLRIEAQFMSIIPQLEALVEKHHLHQNNTKNTKIKTL